MKFLYKTSERRMCVTCEVIRLKYIETYLQTDGNKINLVVCPVCNNKVEGFDNGYPVRTHP